MSGVLTRIAGVAIRDSALARDATGFVRDAATQMLFDHSQRAFLWASLKAEQLSVEDDTAQPVAGMAS